ncbi:hypothetical protein RI129_010374 [Pyrocoelia pectoralis]|uniref:Uncharacterized protein n=1 Tax=Pyrocoelia pectoralis TaxID=417401 RepID=A0AAN7ZH06_9COLE
MLNIPSLETLIITNNHLQSLVEGCFHENLEYLNLEFNSLSQITEGVLKPLKNLKELNLSHNRFKGIELSYGLPSLESLDLSHNEIVVIVEDSFKNFWELKSLKLDHNYLTAISYKIFPTGNSITTLHLHYNAFMYIPETTAQILPKLREITIGGNPWACPCLVIVTGYLQEKNITQPECDRKYFSIGRSAVCVITDDESCTYEEKLTQVDFNNFRSSLQQDLCFEL